MINQEISVTRSRATMKPRVTQADLPFFYDTAHHNVYLGIGSDSPAYQSDTWRSRVNELPYALFWQADNSTYEEKGFETALPQTLSTLNYSNSPGELNLDYEFVGGFNNNAMRVTWNHRESGDVLWVVLKTFTGIQIKYVIPDKEPEVMFAFADEDAYCYCDYSPCEECVFRCKHGFVLYAYCGDGMLVRQPCDRMSQEFYNSQ